MNTLKHADNWILESSKHRWEFIRLRQGVPYLGPRLELIPEQITNDAIFDCCKLKLTRERSGTSSTSSLSELEMEYYSDDSDDDYQMKYKID